MGPSKIDLEIRALGPNGGGSVNLLKQFLRFATSVCMSKQNFENGQAYLALFLKVWREDYVDIHDKNFFILDRFMERVFMKRRSLCLNLNPFKNGYLLTMYRTK